MSFQSFCNLSRQIELGLQHLRQKIDESQSKFKNELQPSLSQWSRPGILCGLDKLQKPMTDDVPFFAPHFQK